MRDPLDVVGSLTERAPGEAVGLTALRPRWLQQLPPTRGLLRMPPGTSLGAPLRRCDCLAGGKFPDACEDALSHERGGIQRWGRQADGP